MSSNFLSPADIQALTKAIGEAEKLSTGEIKIHIDSQSLQNHALMALERFKSLNMDQTKARNGVLFYVNFEDKYLCVFGDKGIHACVTQAFWDEIHDEITQAFSKKNYLGGLLAALAKTGLELKKHFPISGHNPNELSNEITFS
jgi:uncharacterized membrane protein